MLRNQLKPAIKKRRDFLPSAACLQNDNARPHAARRTVKQVQDLKLEVLALRHIHQRWRPAILKSFAHKRHPTWTSLQIG